MTPRLLEEIKDAIFATPVQQHEQLIINLPQEIKKFVTLKPQPKWRSKISK